MKKIIPFVLVVLLSLVVTHSVLADSSFRADDDRVVKFGLKISQETVSQTDDINGGSYLFINPLISFGPKFSLHFKYSTDLAPLSFSDGLFSITPQFVLKNSASSGDTPDSQMSLGLTYLKSKNGNYYGVKFCPFAFDRGLPDNDGVIIEMFPFSFLYSPETTETIIIFGVVSLGGYF